MIAKSKHSRFLYPTSMSSLLTSKSLSDMKSCFVNRCDFRNFAGGVVTETKHPRGVDEHVQTRLQQTQKAKKPGSLGHRGYVFRDEFCSQLKATSPPIREGGEG